MRQSLQQIFVSMGIKKVTVKDIIQRCDLGIISIKTCCLDFNPVFLAASGICKHIGVSGVIGGPALQIPSLFSEPPLHYKSFLNYFLLWYCVGANISK